MNSDFAQIDSLEFHTFPVKPSGLRHKRQVHAGSSDRASAAALPVGRAGRSAGLTALSAAACQLAEC